MTTIACDGLSMAADGLMCDANGMVTNLNCTKIRRLTDGTIVGIAGSAYDAETLWGWLEGGRSGELANVWEHTEALLLYPDLRVTAMNSQGREVDLLVPTAIGTGTDLAIGAMEAGRSAMQAVEIAARRDIKTGGELVSLTAVAA